MRTPYDFFGGVNDFIQRIQTDFPLALFSVNSMFHKTITIWTEQLNLQRFRGEFRQFQQVNSKVFPVSTEKKTIKKLRYFSQLVSTFRHSFAFCLPMYVRVWYIKFLTIHLVMTRNSQTILKVAYKIYIGIVNRQLIYFCLQG